MAAISMLQAILLGIVEGLTEFIPVSSTGHLILAAYFLGIHGEAAKTFEVVIQAGALVAVAWLYRGRIVSLGRSVVNRDESGLRLLKNLLISFVPFPIVGFLFYDGIKSHLFGAWPVVAALATGGVLMVMFDRPSRAGRQTRGMGTLTAKDAAIIGLAQCCAFWPGMSRSMVTILAGICLGLPGPMAAEYSFLLALPSMGAATLFEAAKGGPLLFQETGWIAIISGFLTTIFVAMFTIRAFIGYLQNHGLVLFGWYRIALALAMCFLLA